MKQEKKTLLNALKPLAKIINTKIGIPIYLNVVFERDGNGRQILRASNAFEQLAVSFENDDPIDGISVGIAKLISCISAIDSDVISLSVEDYTIKVSGVGTRRKFSLQVADSDGFTPPNWQSEGLREFDTAPFVSALKSVQSYASNDMSRPSLAQVLLFDDGLTVNAVATDGHRIACVSIARERGLPDLNELLVKNTVPNIANVMSVAKTAMLGVNNGRVTVSVRDDGVDYIYTTGTSSETFPPYRQVFPAGVPTLKFDAPNDILPSIKAIRATRGSGNITMKFQGNTLSLSCNDAGIYEAEDTISIDAQGKDITVVVNNDYLIDALDRANDGAEICLFGELDPIRISDESIKILIMPARSS